MKVSLEKEHLIFFIQHKISWNQGILDKTLWIQEIFWKLASLNHVIRLILRIQLQCIHEYIQFYKSYPWIKQKSILFWVENVKYAIPMACSASTMTVTSISTCHYCKIICINMYRNLSFSLHFCWIFCDSSKIIWKAM